MRTKKKEEESKSRQKTGGKLSSWWMKIYEDFGGRVGPVWNRVQNWENPLPQGLPLVGKWGNKSDLKGGIKIREKDYLQKKSEHGWEKG